MIRSTGVQYFLFFTVNFGTAKAIFIGISGESGEEKQPWQIYLLLKFLPAAGRGI